MTERDKMIPGTLNVLVLKCLSHGARHGYGVSAWIQEHTDEVLQVEEGVLYPALHRLERDGLIEAEWGINDTGRRAKFYALTKRGETVLEAELQGWRRRSAAVNALLDLTPGSDS
ncbi:MAG: PadR family transcriptional regulator [Acidobacteria bacterium]|nr:PadR family transcriptional regulator [Acidobacteriota bacterium]